VTRAPVVAVTAGVARPADNLRGGTAVILHGDDGMQYYYAHLAERRLDTRRRVAAGEVLGRVGRTGRWTRYLEPHLHFSVAGGHHAGLAWETDVYASHWLREHFGLGWRETPADRGRRAAATVRERREGSAGPERDIPPSSAAVGYPAAVPRGRLFPAAGTITADFDEMAARNPDLAGIRVRPPDGGASASTHGRESSETTGVPVATPLTGEVNVIRGTVLGLRVQVTNRPADASIILSGLRSVTVRDGEIVTAGTRIATVGRDESLLYNYFLDGELVDPEPSFSPEETGLD
jgi:murein DD-endopeptidase MepM/ murein hydrolase activator NlpD